MWTGVGCKWLVGDSNQEEEWKHSISQIPSKKIQDLTSINDSILTTQPLILGNLEVVTSRPFNDKEMNVRGQKKHKTQADKIGTIDCVLLSKFGLWRRQKQIVFKIVSVENSDVFLYFYEFVYSTYVLVHSFHIKMMEI